MKVKPTMNNIQNLVERLEQKKKLHDISAKVVVDIEKLEQQQDDIMDSVKENSQLLKYLKESMAGNLQTIKKNIEYLK